MAANFKRLSRAGLFCCVMLEDTCDRVRAAANKRDTAKTAAEENKARFARMEEDLLEGIATAMSSVGTDARLPAEQRAKMADFWQTFKALSVLVKEDPFNKTFAEYEARYEQESEKFFKLGRELAIKLGFNDDWDRDD
jgi:hypothetical protein